MSDVLAEVDDQNPCCRRRWTKMQEQGTIAVLTEWECPSCGTFFSARLVDGLIRVWEVHEWTAIL